MSRLPFTCALVCSVSIACSSSSGDGLFREPDSGASGDASAADGAPGSDAAGSETAIVGDADQTEVSTGPCTAGATDKQACGMCGSKIRVCNSDQTWSSFSTCSGETGVCTAGQSETETCVDGKKKTRTCSATCTWGAFGPCEGVVPCASGATEDEACGTCGNRVRVCSSGGVWSDWSLCTEMPGCTPTGDELWLATVASNVESSVAVTIERLRLSDGSLVSTIPIRTTAAGAHQPLTLFGASGFDGGLARSTDGRYVTLGGYAAAPGVATVSTTSSVPRVFARIDASRNVDTTTSATNLAQKPLYSVVSVDGSAFWGVGDSVSHIAFGAAGTASQPFASGGSSLAILDGTLHIAWQDLTDIFTPKSYLSKFSPALPTTTTATATPLMQNTGTLGGTIPSFDGFFGLARGGGTVDSIYVAMGPSVDHWTRSGTTWTKTKSVTMSLGTTESTAYVTGFVQGSDVIFFASVRSDTGSRLIKCVDSGTLPPVCNTVRTATGTVRYRGVALAPKI